MAIALAAGLLATRAHGIAAEPQSGSTAFERALEARLARAARAGHGNELARLGARAGARGLRSILLGPARAGVPSADERAAWLGAVLAAPAAEDAWDLLAPLAVHAAGPDRLLATSAAASAAAIAARMDREWHAIYDAQDIAPALLDAARQEWLDLARDPGRWVDVRVLALETGVSLHRVVHGFPGDAGVAGEPARAPAGVLAEIAAGTGAGAGTDADPALRRAAFELMDTPLAPAQRALAAAAVHDPEPEVALAAAQALCSGLALDEDPAPVLAALDEPGRARVRVLIAVPAHPPAARIDAARCLAAAGSAPDRRALEALRATLPRDLRDLTPRAPGRRRGQDQP